MNINRNNYEEYFLLYADNELSQAEKNEVENFVQQNVDLAEEFNMVKLTINVPDENVSLTDKSFLMKQEPSAFINENNYEEVFVWYYDHELTVEQKNETEEFIKRYPRFYTEFELFGKAKLIPDAAVVFPDKKQLYRSENAGKVVPLIFWRSIAAAVFIGMGLWAVTVYFNQKEAFRATAFEKNTFTFPAPVVTPEPPADKENGVAHLTQIEDNKNDKGNEEIIHQTIQREKQEPKSTIVKTTISNQFLPEEKSIIIDVENHPKMLASNTPVTNAPDFGNAITSLPVKEEVQPHIDQEDPRFQTLSKVQNATYAVDAGNNTNENYVFYNVTTEDFNKSKVGGFLKKVKRMVERSNPITRLIAGEDKQVAAK